MDYAINLLTIANNINKDISHFQVSTVGGVESISLKRCVSRALSCFSRDESQIKKLQETINREIEHISSLDRSAFVDLKTNETTSLFLAAQKYNQTITAAAAQRIESQKALANRITLNPIKNDRIPELNPSKVLSITDMPTTAALQADKPEIVKERRLLRNYQVRRYPGDRHDHGKDAQVIFLSTQKERLLSAIGRILEAIARLFNFTVTRFQKYHYRKNNETDAQIYAKPTSPISLSQQPTSYWLGHASLFLNVPLKSVSGSAKASFNIITDPVEGDLNTLLYPRQTKFALPVEQIPAPDVYLLSHNHLDHYNKETVKKIFAQQPIMVVPKGDGSRYTKLAKGLGFDNAKIIEFDWWEKKEITFEKNGEQYRMQITATPAKHWCGQGPYGGHESTFLGYVIQGNETGDIYFAGDTARITEDHITKLREHFNIRWNFQPGGPDEVRINMERTHQASVDGLWMHFKLMAQRIYKKDMDKAEFMKQAAELKTIYMHTMTYKLGNLHVSDTKDSIEKVLGALVSNDETVLKSYEKQVYQELCQMTKEYTFADKQSLSPTEVAQLIRDTVIVPKIGSRLNLEMPKAQQLENMYF